MRGFSTEAIILRRDNFGEADKLITFLTSKEGKVSAVAKGVRKITSRRAPNLELFNHVKLFLVRGKNIDNIGEVETLQSFKDFKEDLSRVGYAYKVAELVDQFAVRDQESFLLFNLFLTTLGLLDREKNNFKAPIVLIAFETKLLGIVGYKPHLTNCVRCKKQLAVKGSFFSAELGGIVDSSCAGKSILARPISVNAIKILRFFQIEDWDRIVKLSLESALQREVDQILNFYIEYLLETELKTNRLIRKISNG
ncbi:MAG: DNA repair protein RecO [Candidatus Woykebacteria bacterium RBG_16_39_9b]|uniref:DNA repair protein RecO n=1 Tax=Candidatus Woykebacteria bacterium RBG_16_39_9b TaxID=1802595 RepID=A0A1G1WDE1_9BACT|nr:MAG: DNA repair protein RecO [Candidatus Woykebacteria bacterium RBG_16_39_9b]